MPDAPAEPLASFRSRWQRVGRWLFTLGFLALPLLGIGGLGALWLRSAWVEQGWEITRRAVGVDPLTSVPSSRNFSLELTAPRGLVALTVGLTADWGYLYSPAEPVTWSLRATRYDQPQPIASGAPFSNCVRQLTGPEVFELDPDDARAIEFRPADPDRPFDLPRDDHALSPLTDWSWESRGDDPTQPTGEQRNVLFLLAPVWLWMLPLVGPILWWLWCPPGRFWPRISLRRLAVVMAGLALILALIGRAPAADRAVLVLSDFQPVWYYGRDPGGQGSPPIIGLDLSGLDDPRWRLDWTPAQVESVRTALASLPHLRYLNLGSVASPPSLITSLLPERWPTLEVLLLSGAQADDATVARLGAGYPRLQRLNLGGSHVTDAGLIHLRRLPDLTHLGLGDLPLTDAGLAHLHGLPHLRRLDLRALGQGSASAPAADLSAAAFRALIDSLPSLEELISPDGTVLRPIPPPPPASSPKAQP